MRLSWGEIRNNAKAFAKEWADAHYEKGETQSFYNDFFAIFGVNRKRVAIFEKRVELIDRNKRGFIDLFWPGVLVAEQKSAGRDLLKAQQQAFDYIEGLPERDQPRFVLTCDFQRFRLIDLENSGRSVSFTLPELHRHVEAFAFILGVQRRSFGTQAAVNIKAAELMGRLHDALEASGYVGHDLERLLVRLLFCLFADDTGIFAEKDDFLFLIEERTAPDGSDTGRWLADLFDTLDTPEDRRQTTLDPELKKFPYVNGALFTERLRTPAFDAKMREMLLDAAKFDWGKVSPAIFGSLFQSVMDADERRKKGAHYTTETNILKVIGPLFLDELKAELTRLKARRDGGRGAALQEFQRKLSRLNFLDPACGCGNFLVITYRELRALELEALKEIWGGQSVLDVELLSLVKVKQFYGIEYEEFPAYIAEVAMWMTDHLANSELGMEFGKAFAAIPLKDSATIRHGDALEVDWNDLLPHERCFAVLGNPPFVGAKFQSEAQRAQVRRIAALGGSGGTLDYVAAWFIKAGAYVARGRTRIGFVATNSITQGEQVAQLWPILFDRHGLEIAFAHRTFAWGSDARGKAHVHVVIIGLTHRDFEPETKRLFSYADINGEPTESRHGALTAYLFDARTVANRHLVVEETTRPISARPALVFGNMPNDDGNLILSPSERVSFLEESPGLAKAVRPLLGARDFIDGDVRYCLWLLDVDPALLQSSEMLLERLRKNRAYRSASSRKGTQKLADYPGLFGEIRHTNAPFVLIPRHSSERRDYVPLGFFQPDNIAHDSCLFMPNASAFDFGMMSSRMHMAWLRHIGGRIKSDVRYSIGLVFNTFPWPDATPSQRQRIEALAQDVLDARAKWPTASLAALYDPDTMPGNLRAAHAKLDAAVDKLYRAAAFASDRDRVEHLFGLYEALVNPIETAAKRKARRARATA
jgi:hypothetical protein